MQEPLTQSCNCTIGFARGLLLLHALFQGKIKLCQYHFRTCIYLFFFPWINNVRCIRERVFLKHCFRLTRSQFIRKIISSPFLYFNSERGMLTRRIFSFISAELFPIYAGLLRTDRKTRKINQNIYCLPFDLIRYEIGVGHEV